MKGFLPSRHGITLSKDQCPNTPDEIERMKAVPYSSTVGGLMYAILSTIPDICIADSTKETEYMVANEAVWLRNFLMYLDMVPSVQ